MILDSGARREYESGAVRDVAQGKGRCDLLPLDVAAQFVGRSNPKLMAVIGNVDNYVKTRDGSYLYSALGVFCELVGWSKAHLLLEVSHHFEEGAIKYSERNWEKGIPAHCYVDSAIRHLLKWSDGIDDENHERAFCWNIMCLLWTMEHVPEMDDLPKG